MIASGMVALAIGDTKTMRGLFCWTIQQIGKGVRGTCGPGKPLKTPLSVQYRLIYDRGELTMGTFRDVYRNLAVTPLSLGALRRKGKKETSQRGLGKGSAFSISEAVTPESGDWARSRSVEECVILSPGEDDAPVLGKNSVLILEGLSSPTARPVWLTGRQRETT